MKKVQEERKTYVTVFEAEDGTRFSSEDECRKYEATARFAVESAYRKTFSVPNEEDCFSNDLFPMSYISDDESIYAIKIGNVDELEVFNRLAKDKGMNVRGADVIGKVLVFVNGYDGDLYDYGTLDDIQRRYEEAIKQLEEMANKRFANEQEV